MGKKRTRDNELSLLLVIVMGVLLLTPIALIIGRFYFSEKVNKVRQRLGNGEHYFDYSMDECVKLKNKKIELQRVSRLIEVAKQKGIDANLSINKDGQFSARSDLGKSIRAVLSKYEPMKSLIISDIALLENAPQSRRDEFNSDIQQQYSCEWGLYAWFATFLFSYLYDFIFGSLSVFGCLFVSGVFALIAYAVGYFFVHVRAAEKFILGHISGCKNN